MKNPQAVSESRITWPAGTMLFPLPAVLVSCGTMSVEDRNLITIAWTGILSTNPPRCYISIRPDRFSYKMIFERREFVINLTTRKLVRAADWCGVRSRSQSQDKFTAMNLTPIPAKSVAAPMLAESPLNLECRVYDVLDSGSHHIFMADILHVHADPSFYDEGSGKFDLAKAKLVCYSHGQYFALGEALGHFGFSVKKKT